MGTFHLSHPKFVQWIDTAKSLIPSSDLYVGEIDLGTIQNFKFDSFSYQPHPKILKLIEKRRPWFLDKYHIDLEEFKHLPVPVAIGNLTLKLLGGDIEEGSIDQTLFEYAYQLGKPIDGLESLSDQQEIMDKLADKNHIQPLLKLIKKPKSYRKHLNKMITYYQKGEIQKLYKIGKKHSGGVRKLLIYDRNAAMTIKIAHLIEANENIFVSVGLGHLSGKFGIIKALKNNGFKVKAIDPIL